jgi:LacI family transcriptional regulator
MAAAAGECVPYKCGLCTFAQCVHKNIAFFKNPYIITGMKPITIKDIAKKLGISHTTVSRSIHDDPRISEATKEKVLALAEKMNYSPNIAARGLARAKSNTIAIVTFSYFSSFPNEAMLGIEPEIIKSRFEMDYYTTRRFTVVGTQGRDAYIFEKILDERKADAVIVLSVRMSGNRDIIERYRKAGIHVVFVEGADKWGHRVHYDNEMAAGLAVSHLAGRKRRKIGIIVGDTRYVESFRERLAGFKKAMAVQGLRVDDRNVFEFQKDNPELHRTALNYLLKNGMDALYVAAGDRFTIRVLDEARKLGLKVPDDLALVSQDDFSFLSEAAGATVVRQPAAEMGRKAVEIAVRAIEENDFLNMRDEIFYPELIIRKST